MRYITPTTDTEGEPTVEADLSAAAEKLKESNRIADAGSDADGKPSKARRTSGGRTSDS